MLGISSNLHIFFEQNFTGKKVYCLSPNKARLIRLTKQTFRRLLLRDRFAVFQKKNQDEYFVYVKQLKFNNYVEQHANMIPTYKLC